MHDERTDAPRCSGALLLEHRTGRLIEFQAGIVLLATGGLGQAFRRLQTGRVQQYGSLLFGGTVLLALGLIVLV